MKNEAKEARNKIRRLLRNKNISSYRIAKETGLYTSQIANLRDNNNLDRLTLKTAEKLIAYYNEVEDDPFRTK